ncbi:hypothetical protein DPMN_145233 [Dreissena polymorpha]|uniref:Transmembrane protein n=1 Tax=Dreissena polymorpha TaxID=45954 RepID=A0A9D4F6A6_DREPO|nr:hypothetical protein DPMN_145233 [Dreissena polymorpha]
MEVIVVVEVIVFLVVVVVVGGSGDGVFCGSRIFEEKAVVCSVGVVNGNTASR